MKIKFAFASLLVTMMGVSSAVCAEGASYYPPERIDCRIDAARQLDCDGFNRQYLVEDVATADLGSTRQALRFTSGAAYFNSTKDESTIFYTYHDNYNKTVKLKTTRTSIRPDFKNGSWVKSAEDIYVCRDGYMTCLITE